jgi:hypothetical protein
MRSVSKSLLLGLLLALPLLSLALAEIASGLNKGDHVSAYEPHFVAGPDAGTSACPT